MKLPEENERILAQISTYDRFLANALRRACNAAEIEGPSEADVAKQDAYFKKMDSVQRAKQYGSKPTSITHEESLKVIGLRDYEYSDLVSNYGKEDVDAEVEMTVRKIKSGISIIRAASVIRCELDKTNNGRKTV